MLLLSNMIPGFACEINDVHTSLKNSTDYDEMYMLQQNVFVVASSVVSINRTTKFYFVLIF